jgi:hypothetical protein
VKSGDKKQRDAADCCIGSVALEERDLRGMPREVLPTLFLTMASNVIAFIEFIIRNLRDNALTIEISDHTNPDA